MCPLRPMPSSKTSIPPARRIASSYFRQCSSTALRRRRAVENVDVPAGDVHVVEEGLEHPAVVALQPIGAQAVVFVEVEGDDPRKVELLLAVHADQFAVDADRRGAGGQPQDGVVAEGVPLADRVGDDLGDVAAKRPRSTRTSSRGSWWRESDEAGIRESLRWCTTMLSRWMISS